MKIPGIYVEISGDASKLKKEMAQAKEYIASQAGGISDALNNALSSGKVEQGVNRLVQQFGTLNRSMKLDKASFGNVGVDLKSLTSLTGLTEQQFGKLQSRMLQTQAANAQEQSLKRIASACGLTEKEVRSLGIQFGMSAAQIDKVVGASKRAESSLSVLGGVAKTALAYFSVVQIAQFGKEAFDTGVQVDSLNRAILAISGSQSAAAGEMAFLSSVADSTGQNMYKLADGYKQLSASTKGTALEGEKTREVFTAVSEASAVLGLSQDRLNASLTALAQMASKGTVQMEELKGQLGDHIPGAVQMAARAMGVTTEKLIKMAEVGELLAVDVLPAIAKELHNLYGEAAQTAALESGQAAVNRLSEAWTGFKSNIYESSKSVIIPSILAVAEALKTVGEYAGMRSVWGTFTEGAALAEKGVIDWNKFSRAGFMDRQKMVDELTNSENIAAKNFTTTWQNAERQSMLDYSAYAAGRSKISDKQHQNTLKYIETERQRIEAAYQSALKGAGSDTERTAVEKKYKEELVKLGKKDTSESLKGERTALKELNAEITGYTAEAKTAQLAADRWHKSSLDSIDGIARLNDELATSTMGEYGHIAYEAARMIKDGSQQIEEYQLSLSTADKAISTTAAQYEIAVARLAEARAKLGNNAAGSDAEDANKLRELDKEVGALSLSLQNQTQDYYNLQEAQKLAVTTQDELTAKSRFTALAGAYRQIGTISSELYEQMKRQEQDEYNKFIELTGDKVTAQKLMKQHMEELDLNNPSISWARNVEIGLDRVASLANHTGESIAAAIGDGFSSATDALADFAATGKLEFSSLAESIIRDMARMEIQQNITSPLASGLGSIIGSFFGSSSGGATTGSQFSLDALFPSAKGNVFSTAALSAYSNSIVSKPTIFPFAKGIGLMGEDGDEAIMPLARTSGGKLGVQADISGVGGGNANVVVNVIESSTKAGTQQRRSNNGVDQIDVFVESIKGSIATDIARGDGSITTALQSTYGLNRAHGSY